jgi:hypothetical protein
VNTPQHPYFCSNTSPLSFPYDLNYLMLICVFASVSRSYHNYDIFSFSSLGLGCNDINSGLLNYGAISS